MSKVANIVEDLRNIETLAQPAQEQLISGENIKTINGESVLGAGDLIVGATVDYKEFTTSGTWTKPAGINFVYVELLSGGANANASANGTGGSFYAKLVPASTLNSTEPVIVGGPSGSSYFSDIAVHHGTFAGTIYGGGGLKLINQSYNPILGGGGGMSQAVLDNGKTVSASSYFDLTGNDRPAKVGGISPSTETFGARNSRASKYNMMFYYGDYKYISLPKSTISRFVVYDTVSGEIVDSVRCPMMYGGHPDIVCPCEHNNTLYLTYNDNEALTSHTIYAVPFDEINDYQNYSEIPVSFTVDHSGQSTGALNFITHFNGKYYLGFGYLNSTHSNNRRIYSTIDFSSFRLEASLNVGSMATSTVADVISTTNGIFVMETGGCCYFTKDGTNWSANTSTFGAYTTIPPVLTSNGKVCIIDGSGPFQKYIFNFSTLTFTNQGSYSIIHSPTYGMSSDVVVSGDYLFCFGCQSRVDTQQYYARYRMIKINYQDGIYLSNSSVFSQDQSTYTSDYGLGYFGYFLSPKDGVPTDDYIKAVFENYSYSSPTGYVYASPSKFLSTDLNIRSGYNFTINVVGDKKTLPPFYRGGDGGIAGGGATGLKSTSGVRPVLGLTQSLIIDNHGSGGSGRVRVWAW